MTIPILIRVIEGIIEGDITTTYAYDANGNRASQAADEVAVMYTYNGANLVTSQANHSDQPSGKTVVSAHLSIL